jgi:hypothetical protein
VKYLVIENKGEIVPEALFLMGASTKRNDASKIGMFGTGNKFALAVLLRDNIQVQIYAGQTKYTFLTDQVNLRDQSFSRVLVKEGRKSPVPTNFTTEMGLGWDAEGAFRELVSNAYDEEQPAVFTTSHPEGKEGYTRIVLGYSDTVAALHKDFDRLFLFGRKPLEKDPMGHWALYSPLGPGFRVYRKGILVYQDQTTKAAFDYELNSVEISDERKASWSAVNWSMAEAFDKLSIENKRVVFKNAQHGDTAEGKCDYVQYFTSSSDWQEIVGGKVVTNSAAACLIEGEATNHEVAVVSAGWESALQKVDGVKSVLDVIGSARMKGYTPATIDDLDDSQKETLTEALTWMEQAGMEISITDLNLFAAKATAPDGEYDLADRRLLLNVVALLKGPAAVIKTLIKIFIERQINDLAMTRSWQDKAVEYIYTALSFKIQKQHEAQDSMAEAAFSCGASLDAPYI